MFPSAHAFSSLCFFTTKYDELELELAQKMKPKGQLERVDDSKIKNQDFLEKRMP